MRNFDSKMVEDYEKEVKNLRSRLKNTLDTIEHLQNGNIEKAQVMLEESVCYPEYQSLNRLIDSLQPSRPQGRSFEFLKTILDNLPFPVFIKDEEGRYVLINKMEVDLFGLAESEVLGKVDSDFVKDPKEMEVIRQSDEEVLRLNKSIELPNQRFSLPNNRTYEFKTYKIPIVNPMSGKKNILGFSIDVTDSVNLEKLKQVMVIVSNPYL